MIYGLNWECFKSSDYELQNYEDNDNLCDVSALHKNHTFSVVDIMFYNDETILFNEDENREVLDCEHHLDGSCRI